MLNQKYPEVLDWGKYLETTSSCRAFTAYTWAKSKQAGHPQPDKKQSKLAKMTESAAYPYLGPKYKLPSNLPEGDDEISMLVKSHCTRDATARVPRDTRFSKQGIIKGLVQLTSNPNGPGHYNLPEDKYGAKGYTFPKAIETPDEVRARSVATSVPPPGSYEVRGIFDYSDDEEEDSRILSSTSTTSAAGAKKH
mmetsp:Transcript_1511/g.3538  ORF Transcript_1511/g.3538 Transcript_1511/m.3538 type:complete len:194 (-) Transcript_1511:307-888(-)|eukprot:CAMPEP_0178997086 /NCGR_PEP_ID=MMETSP0795-20121207/8736_1 /TAXON_ID=88552 /ORGANISM="Amoebophrya sp., Strain Ameob2" /LENGTH=193 /DNA_ID=CAMNT_0020689563 /DNA_START=133 /DNA_END=714 /DNA_ORIENTATION=+